MTAYGGGMTMLKRIRAQLGRRVFTNRVLVAIGENPLAVVMITWGAFTAINMVTGSATSVALGALPSELETSWNAIMIIGAIVLTISIAMEREPIQAAGLYLFACAHIAYGSSVIAAAGWTRGGRIGTFLIIMGLVCFLRGWWLKTTEAMEIRLLVRARHAHQENE